MLSRRTGSISPTCPATATVTDEKTNGTKISRLLIDIGTETLRAKFDSYFPPVNLDTELKKNTKSLKKLLYKHVLNRRQWDKLFPSAGSADSKTFDISLLCLLLRNICNLPKPVSGWDKEPPSTDRTQEANLVRIKFYRNEIYGHITNTSLDKVTFEKLWINISNALVELGADEGEIAKLKEMPLEEDKYLDLISEWQEQEKGFISMVKELRKDVEELKSRKPNRGEQQREKEELVLKELKRSEFKGDVEEYAAKYMAGTREWLFQQVDTWFKSSMSTHVMVVAGKAGTGKSVISAQICKKWGKSGCLAAKHFCKHNISRYNNPMKMFKSLANHFCETISGYQKVLLDVCDNVEEILGSNIKELFTLLFTEPLNQLKKPKRNYLVVIDGLDESEYNGRNDVLDIIASDLGKLPRWLKFFITTRPERRTMDKLQDLFPTELKCDNQFVNEDIKTYFENKVNSVLLQNKSPHPEVIIDKLVQKSDGMFLYSYFLVEIISQMKTPLTAKNFDHVLPSAGISSVYEDYFERLKKSLSIDNENFLQFLAGFAVSREPLPIALALKLLEMDSIPDLATQNAVCKAIEEISILLPIRERKIHVFHKSVCDWLLDPYYFGVGPHRFHVRSSSGHQSLFRHCEGILNLYKNNDDKSNEIEEAEEYALRHATYHLCECVTKIDQQKQEAHVVHNLLDLKVACRKLDKGFNLETELHSCCEYLQVSAQTRHLLNSFLDCVASCSTNNLSRSHLLLQICANTSALGQAATRAKEMLKCSSHHWVEKLACVKDSNEGFRAVCSFPCSSSAEPFAVSPSENFFACNELDKNKNYVVSLWSLQNRRFCWQRNQKKQTVPGSIVFSPKGDLVVCESLANGYEVNGGDEEPIPLFSTSETSDDMSFSKAFYSSDCKQLLTLSSDKNQVVRVWEMESEEEKTLYTGRGEIQLLAFSPNGEFVASVEQNSNSDYIFLRRNSSTGHVLSQTELPPNQAVKHLVFIDDGMSLMCAGKVISVWRLNQDGTQLREVQLMIPQQLQGATSTGVVFQAFNQSYSPVYSCKDSHFLVEIVSTENHDEAEIHVINHYQHTGMENLQFMHTFKNNRIHLVRYHNCSQIFLLTSSKIWSKEMLFNSNGDTLSVLDGDLRNYSTPTGDVLDGHHVELTEEEYADQQHMIEGKDEVRVILHNWGGHIKLWDPQSHSKPKDITPSPVQGIVKVLSSPRHHLLTIVAQESSRIIEVWNTRKRQQEFKLCGHRNEILDIDYSADGEYLIALDNEGEVVLWSTKAQNKEEKLYVGKAEWIKFCPALAKGVVSAGQPEDNSINLWNVSTGKLLCSFEGHDTR